MHSCIASYPGPLTPAFVACSSNTGEGLVKLITCHDVPGRFGDVWRSGIFLLYSRKVTFELKRRHQDYLMLSAQSFYGPCLQSIVHSLTCTCGFSWNVPLLHMSPQCPGTSLHVISPNRPSPMLVLHVTNTGVRSPGYEASLALSLLWN